MLTMSNMRIKGKLIMITMVTCLTMLLLAFVAFFLWQWVNLRKTMVNNLSIQAAMIAHNSQAALSFEDVGDAEQTLQAFVTEPSIVFGCIYDTEGGIFATYYRKDMDNTINLSTFREEGHRFGNGYLTVFEPITLDGEIIGIVCIRSDLRSMHNMLRRNIEIMVVILLTASLLAYLVSAK